MRSLITLHIGAYQLSPEPEAIRYDDLLNIFWRIHETTSLNHQGVDRGEHNCSVIFFHAPEQKYLPQCSRIHPQHSGGFTRSIVTQIEPACDYRLASEDHQRYFEKRSHSEAVRPS